MSLAISVTILALATLAAGPVRTYTWRVYLGAGLAGFLADSALVRLTGPAAEDVIEALLSALVVVLVVVLATRRRDVRPSALDLTLLGLWAGAGWHLLDTGIVGLGLGIGVLYRRRWRLAWTAAPAALVLALAIPSRWIVVSALILSSGIAAMAWFEWRHGTQRRLDPTGYASSASAVVPVLWHVVPRWLWLTAAEGARRGARLVELQRAT